MVSMMMALAILPVVSCGEKREPASIDIDLVEIDGSINDRRQFRDKIGGEDREKKRYRKSVFQE